MIISKRRCKGGASFCLLLWGVNSIYVNGITLVIFEIFSKNHTSPSQCTYVEDRRLCVCTYAHRKALTLQRLQNPHFSLSLEDKNTQELWNQKTTCMLRPCVLVQGVFDFSSLLFSYTPFPCLHHTPFPCLHHAPS